MTDHLTRTVAAGLDRLGAGPAPAADILAAGAVRRATQARRARIAGTFVAVAVVIMVAVTAAVAVGGPSRRSVPAGPPPAPRWVITGIGCNYQPAYSVALDQDRGTYRTVPYCINDVSPDGRRATVSDYGRDRPSRSGVMTMATGDVRWFENWHRNATWSPDGTRVLLDPEEDVTSASVSLGDPDSGALTRVPLPDYQEHRLGKVIWMAGGTELGATSSCTCLPPDLYVYDLTGRLLREVRAPRADARLRALYPQQASPDGHLLVLTSESTGEGRVAVLALDGPRAGSVVGQFTLTGVFVVGWYDASHLLVRQGARNGGNRRETLDVLGVSGGFWLVRRVVRDVAPDGPEQTQTRLFVGAATDATAGLAF